jgi:mannose-6-phosphate isomerase-like protein (cupin superfamily)
MTWQTRRRSAEPDALAPDGSEIRLVGEVRGASLVDCVLRPGQTTHAVRHRSVEEVWYCLAGVGELWRARDDQVEQAPAGDVVALEPGVGVTIPLGVRFQFRCTSADALELVIATAPPWPSSDEAVPCVGAWAAST